MDNKKLLWISGTKAVAMIAVVLVHCDGKMYVNEYISMATSFSVTLFVLVSGYSSGLSFIRHPNRQLSDSIYKMLPLIEEYLLATAILSTLYSKSFNLTEILKHSILFDIEGSYYFIFFFLQLKLISDIICRVIGKLYVDSKALAWSSLVPVAILCSLFVKHTRLLPLYGGGKYLLGGTYFFVYYLGVLLSRVDLNAFMNKAAFVVSSVAWLILSVLITKHKLPIDRILRPFWGAGDNPPSVAYMLFALSTFIICYISFNYFDRFESKIATIVKDVIVAIGENTYSIFLYHLALVKLLVPLCDNNIILLRIVVFPLLFIVPACVSVAIRKVRNLIKAV